MEGSHLLRATIRFAMQLLSTEVELNDDQLALLGLGTARRLHPAAAKRSALI
jgi:hypothetical protein